MKAIKVKIKNAVRSIPKDVKNTLSSFALGALLICTMLSFLGVVLEKDARISADIAKGGLEPYIEIDIPLQTCSVECSVSEESDLEMLSRCVEEVFGDRSYTERVAFCAVILNRAEKDGFPATVAGVMRSAGIYPSSFEGSVSERSLHAARSAMLGVDPTLGSLYIINTHDPAYSEYEGRVAAVYGDYAFIV